MGKLMKLLSSRGYVSVNKLLIRSLGLHEAVLLGELCGEYEHWETEGKLEDGMFFCSIENLEYNTGLNRYFQSNAIKTLAELEIIEVKVRGIPATRWFRIDEEKLDKFIEKVIKDETTSQKEPETTENSQFVTELQTSLSPSYKQECDTVTCNKNNYKPNYNNKGETLSKDKVASNESLPETTTKNIQETEVYTSRRKRLFDTDDTVESKPKKKGNLFERCVDEAKNRYHDELLTVVLEYLNYRIKSKQHGFGFQAWVNLLNKLDALADFDQEKIKIVEQSLQMKWDTFAELRTWGKKTGCERFGETEDMRSGVPVGEVMDIQF